MTAPVFRKHFENVEDGVAQGEVCVLGVVLCVPLSLFLRLSGVGVVLASLALDGCFGMVSDGF